MFRSNSIKEKMNNFPDDASDLLDALDRFKDKMSHMRPSRTEKIGDKVTSVLQDNVSSLNAKLGQVSKSASGTLQDLDKSMHRSPLYFVVGAAAIGLALGALIPWSMRRSLESYR